jgi:hypothetical protein
MKTLQELFLETLGRPVSYDGMRVIQMDTLEIAPRSIVEVRFVGDKYYENNAAVIALKKNGKGKIFLSDGSSAKSVATWDDPRLPRFMNYVVETPDGILQVYNKYRLFHSKDWCTEDSFSGNAGMVVESLERNRRVYKCSSSLGDFSPVDLVFELEWRPARNNEDLAG